MTQNRRTTKGILRAWGIAARRLPADTETRRTQIVYTVPTAVPSHAAVIRPRMPWLALAFATLAVIAVIAQPERFFRTSRMTNGPSEVTRADALREAPARGAVSMGVGDSGGAASGFSSGEAARAPDYTVSTGLSTRDIRDIPILGWFAPKNVPITDTRELLETDYAASMRVRHVAATSGRVQTIVRGHAGRVDAETTSEEFASVTFAIPATELERFRDELRTLAGARFFTERTSSVNRLSQPPRHEP